MINNFLNLSSEDRRDIILETSTLKRVSPVIIEKDFWVCWTLNQIANMPKIRESITFKGGTSLSKVFNLINRFSEDIDLAFQRSYLGFGGDKEPEKGTTKKQIEKRIEDLSEACKEEVRNRFMPALQEKFREKLELPQDAYTWELKIDELDPQTILFFYPRTIDMDLDNYIQPVIKIEMGSRSDDWPVIDGLIISYIEESFKHLFTYTPIWIRTLSVERTFWEKATILHAEFHRPDGKMPAIRSSRHYYDLHQMHLNNVSSTALENIDLLDRVAKHKSIFFRSSWAKYEEAMIGTLRLVPKPQRIAELKHDYIKMQEMFFGDRPSFEDIMDSLSSLEQMINQPLQITI